MRFLRVGEESQIRHCPVRESQQLLTQVPGPSSPKLLRHLLTYSTVEWLIH